jgi:hypothetical protein
MISKNSKGGVDPMVATTTFRGLPVVRTTTADKITCGDIAVKTGMDEYSGWREQEHLEWISELTGLCLVALIHLVGDGYVILTDDSCSEVWLLSKDYWKTTARLLYTDDDDCEDDDE